MDSDLVIKLLGRVEGRGRDQEMSETMDVRSLAADMLTYRIGDAYGEHSVYSGEQAKTDPGRWNDLDQAVIYTARYYSTAMLEKLVHLSGEMPSNQHFIQITIPHGTSYIVVTKDILPGWADPSRNQARAFGSKWYDDRRSAILIVPSVVARMENNVLINPEHRDADQIDPGMESPIWWDERLFQRD